MKSSGTSGVHHVPGRFRDMTANSLRGFQPLSNDGFGIAYNLLPGPAKPSRLHCTNSLQPLRLETTIPTVSILTGFTPLTQAKPADQSS